MLDKWFTAQALSTRDDTLEAVEALARHPDFTLANPNRLRSLVGAFAANQRAFHDASGRGYRFLADMILAVDKLNPQTAAKLVPPLGRWRRFGEDRAALMRAELERIVATPGPQQGRVRAGLEEPGLSRRFPREPAGVPAITDSRRLSRLTDPPLDLDRGGRRQGVATDVAEIGDIEPDGSAEAPGQPRAPICCSPRRPRCGGRSLPVRIRNLSETGAIVDGAGVPERRRCP